MTEYLINCIKKTYDYGNDIGTDLKNLEAVDTDPWRPPKQASIASIATHEATQLLRTSNMKKI